MPDNPRPRQIVTTSDQALAARCARGRILVIDDDAEILTAFGFLFTLEGYACETYSSAPAFLAVLHENRPQFPGPCCLLCDVSMPEMDGLELQRQLAQDENTPLILISGSSGAEEAVTGLHAGALDFLIKPIDTEALLAVVARALAVDRQGQLDRMRRANLTARLATLTERERAVLRRVAQGQTNYEISQDIAIAERTVKLYRQRAMEKLGVATLPELVRIVDEFIY